MELEVSYNENYCPEGRVERRTGTNDSLDGGGKAVGTDCVDRHTFFITPLKLLSRRRSAFAPTMSPTPPTATTNQDSCGGVAGQNLAVLKHLQQLLAPVEGHNRTNVYIHVDTRPPFSAMSRIVADGLILKCFR